LNATIASCSSDVRESARRDARGARAAVDLHRRRRRRQDVVELAWQHHDIGAITEDRVVSILRRGAVVRFRTCSTRAWNEGWSAEQLGHAAADTA